MRVLVVTVVHTPLDARIHHRQIGALRAAGHDVTYAAPWTATGTPPPDETDADLAWLDLPRAAGRRRLAALRAARRLLAARADGHDLVLLHDPELLLTLPGLRLDVPVVWDVHEDTAGALADKPWLPGWLRPAVRAAVRTAERWAERRVHLLLAEEAYRDRFVRPHPVVPNTPVLSDDEPAAPDQPRVVHLGRISRLRGAAELLEAGRRLAPEVTVELIGTADADVRGAVEAAAAAGAVRWHGFVPNEEALAMVAGATAGIALLHDIPNYRASLPTKVVEYMGQGVPAVTTPLPAAAALVERHDAGVVVPFGDADAVVEAVRALRADDGRRRRLGANGRAAALAHHDWRRDGRAFVATLERWAREGAA